METIYIDLIMTTLPLILFYLGILVACIAYCIYACKY